MLDHVGLPASDFERSKRFYEEALSPLGYELLMEPSVSAAGFGRRGKPDFWIAQGDPGDAVHVAFTADDRNTSTLLRGGHRGGRARQRRIRAPPSVLSELLRRLRFRCR